MQSSIEKLRKFFRLEHENGYTNTAVIGGLSNVLSLWEGEARKDKLPEEVIQATSTTLNAYAGLDPQARLESLKMLWKQILEKVPEAGLQKKTAVKPHKPPAPKNPDTSGEISPPSTPEVEVPQQPPVVETRPAEVPPPQAQESALEPAAKPAPRLPPASSPRPERPPVGRSETRPGGVTSKRPIALNAALTVLAGVGPRHAAMLTRLGLNTLGDMLYNFPHRYEDYSQLKPIRDIFYGQQVTVIGEITMVDTRPLRDGKRSITEAVINDGTAGLRLTWFNKPWLSNQLKVGEAISVSGTVEQYLGRLVMKAPDWEPVEVENLHTNRIVPIYPLTANVTQKWLRKLMHQVVSYWAPRLTDHLPESIRQAVDLPELGSTLLQAHFPDSTEKLQAARQRLAFDEIFFIQTGVMRQRRDWQSVPGRVFIVDQDWLETRLSGLPFSLTGTQRKAVDDIRNDLGSAKPMNRLLQGDVGSGKTVVAALATAMINPGGRAGRHHGTHLHPRRTTLPHLSGGSGRGEWIPQTRTDPPAGGGYLSC